MTKKRVKEREVQKKCISELHHKYQILYHCVVVVVACCSYLNEAHRKYSRGKFFIQHNRERKNVYKLYTRSRLKVYFGKILFVCAEKKCKQLKSGANVLWERLDVKS